MLGGVNIQISTEAMCRQVLLDSALSLAPHVRHMSSYSFQHLQQMNTVNKSHTKDASKPWFMLSSLVGQTIATPQYERGPYPVNTECTQMLR